MNDFFKKIKSSDGIGIILLAILVVFAGYMVYFQKDFSVKTSSKTSSKQNLSSYNYYDEYYDEYDYDDYYNNDSYSRYYNSDYYTYNDYYNYDYYNDYEYYYDDYSNSEIPMVQYKTTYMVKKNSEFDVEDPIEYTNGRIKVTYNNVNTNKLGKYTVVYEICSYNNSKACRTISVSVIVMDQNDYTDSSLKGPIWTNYDSQSCNIGSSSCKTYNINKPTAKDPVTGTKLSVSLIDGSVNVNKAGTYVLIYYAQTRNGISGTISKSVIIKDNSYNQYYDDEYYNDEYYNDNYYDNYYDDYYDNYYDDYYNDNYYNNYNNPSSKTISNYEWENTVGYTYRCDNVGLSGIAGWTHVSTDTSNGYSVSNADNHPIFYYNDGYYSGSLNKVDYYCKENCSEDLTPSLGVCTNKGEIKKINTTWVGIYSGTVYSY